MEQVVSKKIADSIKSLTDDQLLDYLNRVNADAKCTYCGGEYGVSRDPQNKNAALVATPVPNTQGIGMWFYPATCIDCGHTILFNASHVVHKLKEA